MHPSVVRQLHASRIFHAVRLIHTCLSARSPRRAGADKSTVSAILRDFEAIGLVERTRSLGTGAGPPGRADLPVAAGEAFSSASIPAPPSFASWPLSLDGTPVGTTSRPMPSARR